MNGWVSLGVLVAATSVLLALLCALLMAVGLRLGRPWLDRAAMEGRTKLLLLLAVAPMLISAVIMTACFAPSALAAVGLMSDHCLSSIHDHIHLCLQHLPTMMPGHTAWLLALLGAVAFTAAGLTATSSVVRGHRALRSLLALTSKRDDSVVWIDSPASLALTAGIFDPSVFISNGFAHTLSEDELGAAVAHERCHARERHGVLKLVALCGSMLHGPATRRALLDLLALACERRADESAAEDVGDRLHVASAIVQAHRATPLMSSPLVLALRDGGASALERRVHALLDPPERLIQTSERRLLILLATVTTVASFEIHHAIEIAVSLLV